ncbi:hypothetical protein [Lacipirellula sp.]|uniref:hypothetical protein n=1 Tax=Lacipirellula sp. TaxID=2691419 RepID=UPI003D13F8BA
MPSASFEIRNPRWLATGANGGRRYLAARCTFKGDDVSVYVFFKDSAEELKLTARLPATLGVECTRYDHIDGIGLTLLDCGVAEGG